MNFEIREPGKKELYSITVLTKKFFPYTNFSLMQIEERAKKNVKYLVARADGRTIGYVDYLPGEPGKIWGLAVVEEWRGKGVGEALFSKALEELRKNGCRKAEIITTTDNAPALRLYKKFGFEYSRPYEKTLPGKEVVVMEKNLEQKKASGHSSSRSKQSA